MFFPILYSEIHYRLKFLSPLYFKKEPEVVFDIPRKVLVYKTDNKLPIYIVVKDSDKYPVFISNIEVNIFYKSNGKNKMYSAKISEFIEYTPFSHPKQINEEKFFCDKQNVFYKFNIDIHEAWINNIITINISFLINDKKYINDNYYASVPHNFHVNISDKESIFPKDWYIGDTHYHSYYTSDQVEFGAPLEMTKQIARAMGLNWFFATDHSYDLDDKEDDYLVNDPNLCKWNKMKKECKKLSTPDMKIVYGEEVSIGNNLQKNIHLLSINNPNFIEGKGDSAEKWFINKPEINSTNIQKIPKAALLIAAHPFDKVPLVQKYTLNRGEWSKDDFDNFNIEFLQIINGQDYSQINQFIHHYLKLLLFSAKQYFILAGNDAHGNFQFKKQIDLPFLKLMCKKEQIFANYFTAFQYNQNDPVKGIKNKRVIISNGPFLNLRLRINKKVFYIGETIKNIEANTKLSVLYDYALEDIHLPINKIILIVGNTDNKDINRINLDTNKNKTSIKLSSNSFVLLVLFSKNNYFALTNPIFVNVKDKL